MRLLAASRPGKLEPTPMRAVMESGAATRLASTTPPAMNRRRFVTARRFSRRARLLADNVRIRPDRGEMLIQAPE